MTLNPLPVGFLDHTVLVHATIPSKSDYLLLNVGQGNPFISIRIPQTRLLYGKFPMKKGATFCAANGVIKIVGVGYPTEWTSNDYALD